MLNNKLVKSAGLIAAATTAGAVVYLARCQYRKNKIQSAMENLSEVSCYIELLEDILADFPELESKVAPFLSFWKTDFDSLNAMERDAAQVVFEQSFEQLQNSRSNPEQLASTLEIAYVRLLTIVGVDIRKENA